MDDFLGSPFFPLVLVLLLIGIVAIAAFLTLEITRGRRSSENTNGEVPSQPAAPGAKTTAAELNKDFLRMRRGASGTWEIRLNGQLYYNISSVYDEPIRQEYAEATRALVLFGKEYLQKQPAAGNKPASAPTPPPPTQSPAGTGEITGTFRSIDPTSNAPRVAPPREPELRRSGPPSLLPVIDLAKEINGIIEEFRPRYPNLSNRVIRLQNAPGGGVNVAIDGIVYATVDQVPDPEIRAMIQAATKEWERR